MTAVSIVERFYELGHEIDVNEVASRIEVLTKQFKVPADDAESSVISYFLRQNGVEREDYYEGSGGNRNVNVADIRIDDGIWYNLRVKFTDLWEPRSEHITQTGLVGDDTGKIKFVIWKNSGLPGMEIGKSYTIDNIVTNVYNGKVSATLNMTSVITEIDDDIEVRNVTSEYMGVMVNIMDGSGLIKRCPECNRALRSGTCVEHGNVAGTNDLRIMATLDNGESTQDVLFGCEKAEDVWGHTLDEAVEMAIESLDAGVVMEDMVSNLVGRYYTISGGKMDTTIFVNECKAI
jgi:replication factor A1